MLVFIYLGIMLKKITIIKIIVIQMIVELVFFILILYKILKNITVYTEVVKKFNVIFKKVDYLMIKYYLETRIIINKTCIIIY